MLYDPEAAKMIVEAGVGEIVDLEIGATTGWRDGGKVRVKGEVLWSGQGKYIGTGPMSVNREVDLGPTGILQVGTHFRAVYEVIGEEIIIIDAPGQCPADLGVLQYRNVKDGVYPITLSD